MPSQYLHSGEPLPLEPNLKGEPELDRVEQTRFNTKLLDYIRRLTAKLSNESFSPPPAAAVESFATKLSTDFTVSGTPDTIIWDDIVRMDSPFDYDSATGLLTFTVDGFYIYLVDMMVEDAVYTTRLWDGTTALGYGGGEQNLTGVQSNLCQVIPVHIHATQVLQFQIVAASGNKVQAARSRMTVLKLGAFAGSGSDSPDPCDFDIWQFCP